MALVFTPAEAGGAGGYDSWEDMVAPEWLITRYEDAEGNETLYCLIDPDGELIEPIFARLDAAHAAMLRRGYG
jgi:hypothetical protein